MTTPAGSEGQTAAPKTYTEAELKEAVQQAVSGATSTVQRENAALKNQVAGLTQERDKAQMDYKRVSGELDVTKKAAQFEGNEESFIAWRTQEEERLSARGRELESAARSVQMERILGEFPHVTRAELDGLKTPYEMEIYALRAPRPTEGEPQPTGASSPPANATPAPSAPTTEGQSQPKPDFGGGAGNATGGQPPASAKGSDKILWAIQQRGDTPEPS